MKDKPNLFPRKSLWELKRASKRLQRYAQSRESSVQRMRCLGARLRWLIMYQVYRDRES